MYSLALRQLPFPVVASPRITYTYIYSCVSPYVRGFFFLFAVCSPAIMVPNAHSGGHPKCIPSYKYKNIYSSEASFELLHPRKKNLPSVCPDVRLILVLVLGRQTAHGQNTVYLCLSKYTVFENIHTHIATAASETEGVPAVSCMESHMIRRPLGLQPVQQYKHHVVRSIARSGVSPPGARRDGHHWCQAARTAATCT